MKTRSKTGSFSESVDRGTSESSLASYRSTSRHPPPPPPPLGYHHRPPSTSTSPDLNKESIRRLRGGGDDTPSLPSSHQHQQEGSISEIRNQRELHGERTNTNTTITDSPRLLNQPSSQAGQQQPRGHPNNYSPPSPPFSQQPTTIVVDEQQRRHHSSAVATTITSPPNHSRRQNQENQDMLMNQSSSTSEQLVLIDHQSESSIIQQQSSSVRNNTNNDNNRQSPEKLSQSTTTRAGSRNINNRAVKPSGGSIESVVNNNSTNYDTWILRIRAPPPPLFPSSDERRRNYYLPSSRIIQIQITQDMSVEILSGCIQQALSSLYTNNNYYYDDYNDSMTRQQQQQQPLAGLFVEETGIFVPLHYILSLGSSKRIISEEQKQKQRQLIYAIKLRPLPPPEPPRRPLWEEYPEFLLVLGIPLCIIILYHKGEAIIQSVKYGVQRIYSISIEHPLHEIYYSGPWFIGWEGESLPRICSRITYHGDERFWNSGTNIQECERIYKAKEEAWLRIVRPTFICIVTIAILILLRFIIWEYHKIQHSRQQQRPTVPVDRDMVETYRAFQVLLRQVRRSLDPPPK